MNSRGNLLHILLNGHSNKTTPDYIAIAMLIDSFISQPLSENILGLGAK